MEENKSQENIISFYLYHNVFDGRNEKSRLKLIPISLTESIMGSLHRGLGTQTSGRHFPASSKKIQISSENRANCNPLPRGQ